MEQTVDIYLLNAAQLAPVISKCLPLLTPSRREIAERYQDQPAKLRVVAAGLLLHQVLGVQNDSDLVFNEFGKPFLTAGGPQFSLSYAGHYAMLATAPFPIGADIEPIKETYPQILRRYLHPEELNWLDQDPCGERFYTLWTRLESALKFEGTGFARRERAYSLLDRSPLCFSNAILNGHMIACASTECFETRQIDVTHKFLII